MIRRSRALSVPVTAIIFVAAAQNLQADTATPFYTVNQNPLIQMHGLPPLESGEVTAAGTTKSWAILDIASNSIAEAASQETITLDGETYRLNFAFRRGIKRNLEVGIDIPYITHTGGTLDGFIRNWHDLFGLSNSERNQFADNQLQYEYTRNGVVIDNITRHTDGIGDIRLSAAWQKRCDKGDELRCTAIRAALKLPTGRAEDLTGSGSVDLSIGATTTRTYERYTFHYGGGLLINGDNDLLKAQQERAVAFGNLGINYQPKAYSWMVLKAQLDGHSAFYNSALKNLGSDSIQVNVGGTIHVTERTALDIGVAEDIVTSTVPDVVFHLALRTRHQ